MTTGRIAQILRHPIKSIGVEEMGSAALTPGMGLPGDRRWAILHEKSKLGADASGQADSWASKINFVIGRSAPELMCVTAALDDDTGQLTLSHPRAPDLRLDPQSDGEALLSWLSPFWPETQPAPTRLARAPGHGMSDQPEGYVSMIGTASLADLETRTGKTLHRNRFRANLWVDGLPPFAEFDLVGQRIQMGEAVAEGVMRVQRCRATDTDPLSGERDIDMLKTLEAEYGHHDLGVFLRVIEPGRIVPGDLVQPL